MTERATTVTGTPGEIVAGICSVCGEGAEFSYSGGSIRESYACSACKASLRYRHQADSLVRRWSRTGATSLASLVTESELAGLDVFEPGIIGPFRRYLEALPGYVQSYYWPGVEPGTDVDGIRCEDLHRLTFADESFDLVISSDIFEHVRRPFAAFAEVRRVLRSGGTHVFTIPMRWPLDECTTSRVDTSGPEDVLMAPAVYHGSPTDPQGSLVYTDFGRDLLEKLGALGLRTKMVPGFRYNVTFVSVRV